MHDEPAIGVVPPVQPEVRTPVVPAAAAICNDFQNGRCYREHCRYQHLDPAPPRAAEGGVIPLRRPRLDSPPRAAGWSQPVGALQRGVRDDMHRPDTRAAVGWKDGPGGGRPLDGAPMYIADERAGGFVNDRAAGGFVSGTPTAEDGVREAAALWQADGLPMASQAGKIAPRTPLKLTDPEILANTPVATPKGGIQATAAGIVEMSEGGGGALFRAALADSVKIMLKVHYKGGTVDKESFKTITRKSVEKLFKAHQHEVKPSKPSIDAFLTEGRKEKIKKLVEAYVKVHGVKKAAP